MSNENKNRRLLEIFFDNISDNLMPSFIFSEKDNTQDIHDIKNKLKEIRNEYIKADVDILTSDFSSKFRKDIINFISFTDTLTKRNTDLTPIFQLSKSINSDIDSLVLLALKDINKEMESEINRIKQTIKNSELLMNPPKTSTKDKFIELFDDLKKYFKPVEIEKEISEETWKAVALESLKRLKNDFNFKTISIEGNAPWKDVCEWASDTYRVIKESQENIGIDYQNTGINSTLSLAYSPKYLSSRSAKAAMFGDASFNTIHLRQTNTLEQKECWQHEYAHVLDNRAGVDHKKHITGKDSLFSENTYLSTSVIGCHPSYYDKLLNSDSIIEKSALWMSESLSSVVGGADVKSFQAYQLNVAQIFFTDIYKNMVQACLPNSECDWLKLTQSQQHNIIDEYHVTNFCKKMVNQLFSEGENKFKKFLDKNNPFFHNEEVSNFFDFIDSKAYKLLGIKDATACDKFLENKAKLVDDLKVYIKNSGFVYDNDSRQNFFFKSSTGNAAVNESVYYQTGYYTKPMEVFARACQGLQTPLMLGTKAFHEINNINKEAIYPVLNKDERTLLVTTLHKMAQHLGLKVNPDLEQIPCLHKQLNKSEEEKFQNSQVKDFTTYSNATGDEHKAKTILEIAKLRENKIKLKNTI